MLNSKEYKLKMLNRIKAVYTELKDDFIEAVRKDHHQEKCSALLFHYATTPVDIDFFIKHIDDFCANESITTNFVTMPAQTYVQYEGLGAALVMGSWNYPIFTTVGPLINCIATGNTVIVKPSEMSENCSKVIAKLVQKLNSKAYVCIEGGPSVAIELTNSKFDLIVFTGSPEKGRLVAMSAAKNLVPCVLELGGKCPFIVDKDADLLYASKKLAGKFANAGQTCVAADYAMVHADVYNQFLDIFKSTMETFHPMSTTKGDIGSCINDFHYNRVKGYLEEDHGGKILFGNDKAHDKDSYFLYPTVIENPKIDSRMMVDEVFGPILTMSTFKDIQEVIDRINNSEKPLATYYFGNNTSTNCFRLRDETETGTFVVNEFLVQLGNPYMPFGGVGSAGMGRYRGLNSRHYLCNPKSVVVKSNMRTVMEKMGPVLEAPWNESKVNELMGLFNSPLAKVSWEGICTFFNNMLKLFMLVLVMLLCWYFWTEINSVLGQYVQLTVGGVDILKKEIVKKND